MNKTNNLTKKQKEELEILRLFNEGEAAEQKKEGEFASLFNDAVNESDIKAGDIVKGSIVEVQTDYVLVDINYMSEGLIPMSEFRVVEGSNSIQPGDEIEVYVDKIENDNGMIVLSKEKADMSRAWNDISRAAENQEHIEGTVIAKVKGGLSVDIGVKAFLPGSQIDLRPVRNMDIYIGKKYKFKVIKFNKKRGNIVLSRRALLEEERESLRSQTKDLMKEGTQVKGIVKNVTDYGAFIDLGGIDGLLHITDMSWARIKHPSEVLNVGDEIDVVVLKYDTEKERVSLGLKQLTEDPWLETSTKFPVETQLSGKVVSLTDYGAFIDVGEGVEGLIHVSEMSWTKRVKHPSQIVNVGDEVNVIVLALDQENRRISLGMKQLQPNPWNELKEAYPPGTIIEGEVKSITDFGVFIGIEEGIDGMVHISDFSWTKRVIHPSEMFNKDDKVRAVVLGVDIENERFSLGIKQLDADPWSEVDQKFTIGTLHEVKVSKVADFGVFVELAPEIEGLVHISELSTKRVNSPEEVCKVGDMIKAEVISIDQDARKVGLSARLAALREQNADVSEYMKKTAKPNASLGDLFSDQLKDLQQSGDNQ
ncbi:MAG: 30S ribosomal protein S1 [Bdellovibrionales bacterium]|nr:30S ribosomal protein S1 [Bdellovibrionales bacterium]NQZ18001.1 30S ribosomal protein S1 [Bdellovibrionales bacterium]